LKSFYYQRVLRIEKTMYCPVVPCPGKKAFASPKKGAVPLFQMRASAVSALLSLCHRISLRRQGKGSLESFSQPFLTSAPAFLPGQQGDRAERPTKWEMIHFFFSKHRYALGVLFSLKFLKNGIIINHTWRFTKGRNSGNGAGGKSPMQSR